MEVKSVTTIVSAEKTTANARYDVSYSIIKDASYENAQLQSVSADVYELQTLEDQVKQENFIGKLEMQYGIMVPTQFPFSNKYPLYVSEFVDIINEVTSKS